MLRGLFVLLVVASTALTTFLAFSSLRRIPLTVSGVVEGEGISLGASFGGRVARVKVSEGDRVKAGDVLVEMDSGELDALSRFAKAVEAERQLSVLQVKVLPDSSANRPESAAHAWQVYEQLQALIARPKPDAPPDRLKGVEAELEQARSHFEQERKNEQTHRLLVAKAALETAKAATASLTALKKETLVTAPSDGVVETLRVRAGSMVPPRSTLLTVLDDSRLSVRTYLPADRLDLRVGQEVGITTPLRPGERFRGRVGFIAQQAEFMPTNVQTTRDRARQVFRLRVTILESRERLRPGMPVDVWLEGPAL
jgi:multidrug resistance efflux pump